MQDQFFISCPLVVQLDEPPKGGKFSASASTNVVKQRERKMTATWKRPDRQRAIARKKAVETFTVKTGFRYVYTHARMHARTHAHICTQVVMSSSTPLRVLPRSVCRDAALGALVHQTVAEMTQLQWEASKIVQLYVLDRIDRSQPIHVLDCHFFYQALVCATGSENALLPELWQARNELYVPHRAPHLPLVSKALRTNLLKLAARTLHGNAVNHVKENFFRYNVG